MCACPHFSTTRYFCRGLLALLSLACAADVVVSPQGNDANPGTEQQPVLTLERARSLLRAQKGGTAWLRAGLYERTATLALGPQDSDTAWQTWPGEQARLTGGRVVTSWKPAAGRPGVFATDLRAQGISNFGALTNRGFGRAIRAAGLELFYRGRPMPLASWPNIGWAYTAAAPAGAQGGGFTVSTDRLSKWTAEPDLWVHGYWTYDWADSYEKVAALSPDAGLIRTEPPHGVYGYAAGKRFQVVNALSELDAPGEWYLDRAAGVLYFYPPGDLRDGDTVVSLLDTPLIQLTNSERVRLVGLTLENTRGPAVEMRNSIDCVVSWSTVRNIGAIGVRIEGGHDNGVESTLIEDTGEGGIVLSGGDRRTLTPSNHYAVGNHLRRFSRWVRTYRPALALSGAGQNARRNRIHHAPHEAIALSGNDHLIEGNDIHTVAWETADVGAFYMGRDFTWRGNILRANFFHNQGPGDVNSVYLDDCAAGTLVENNLFHRAGRGVFIGGGRDNIIRGNVFVDGSPSVQVDARGLTWASYWFDGRDKTIADRLNAMPYQDPPWSDRYPALVNVWDDEPAIPKGNILENNLSWRGVWTLFRDNTSNWVKQHGNLVVTDDPGFVDAASNDFRLRPDAPVFLSGEMRVVFEDLGPAGDVLNYKVESAGAGKVRLVVENLGRTVASGTIDLWTWPEAVTTSLSNLDFELVPGEKITREIALAGFSGLREAPREAWIGARLRGDDLRPLALRVTFPAP